MEKPIAASVVEPSVQRARVNVKPKATGAAKLTFRNIESYMSQRNKGLEEPRYVLLPTKRVVDTEEVEEIQDKIEGVEDAMMRISDMYIEAKTKSQQAHFLKEVETAERVLARLKSELLTALKGEEIPRVVLEEEARRPSKV